MPKALVTGINGFMGKHLVDLLSENGAEIYGLDLSSTNTDITVKPQKVAKIYYADVRDRGSVAKIIHAIKPDYLFHLAGLIISDDLHDLLDINVFGTKKILDTTIDSDMKVLIPGSAAEYGYVVEGKLPISEDVAPSPIDNYGLSKLAQTLLGYQYYQIYGCRVYLSRVFNVSGPEEPERLVCAKIAKQMVKIQREKLEPTIYVGNFETKRDFTDVRDVVKAYWAVVNKGVPGEIYNICSGEAHSIREIVDILSKIVGIVFSIKQDKTSVKRADIPISIGCNEKIRSKTGWAPSIPLKKTLEDLLVALSNNPINERY